MPKTKTRKPRLAGLIVPCDESGENFCTSIVNYVKELQLKVEELYPSDDHSGPFFHSPVLNFDITVLHPEGLGLAFARVDLTQCPDPGYKDYQLSINIGPTRDALAVVSANFEAGLPSFLWGNLVAFITNFAAFTAAAIEKQG